MRYVQREITERHSKWLMREIPDRLMTPPAGVDYGLQKGKGSACEIVQTPRSVGGDLDFEFTAEPRVSGAAPIFAGPSFRDRPAHGSFTSASDLRRSGRHTVEPAAESSPDQHHRHDPPRVQTSQPARDQRCRNRPRWYASLRVRHGLAGWKVAADG
jgi:hypothetical protein